MIHEFPREYRDPLTYQQAEETILRWGRLHGITKPNSLIDCLISFRLQFDSCYQTYELDDEVDIMMETWKYEINAFNTIYSRFAPLFAPKTN